MEEWLKQVFFFILASILCCEPNEGRVYFFADIINILFLCIVPGFIGTLQAIETIKLLLTGKDKGGESLYRQKLLVFDAGSELFRLL